MLKSQALLSFFDSFPRSKFSLLRQVPFLFFPAGRKIRLCPRARPITQKNQYLLFFAPESGKIRYILRQNGFSARLFPCIIFLHLVHTFFSKNGFCLFSTKNAAFFLHFDEGSRRGIFRFPRPAQKSFFSQKSVDKEHDVPYNNMQGESAKM